MLESVCGSARVQGGWRGAGTASPVQRQGGFPLPHTMWEGCFIFRGFGEKGHGEGHKEIKWEGGRFAGTMKNHRHVCRLQQEAQQSRGAVSREILLPQPPWIEVEVVLLACTSCSPLLDQRLVRQEGSHAQSPVPRCSACGRKDGGGGLLGGPESPHPQLGWFEGERRALPFHPGQEEEKQASFAPQVLLNPPPFLCYHSAKPLADAVFAAQRNGAGLPQERNTAAGTASVHLALAQGCNQAGKGPASHSDGEEVLVCRELLGARRSSLKTGLAVLYVDYTLVRLLQHLRSWLSLKPHLGGSADSPIELVWTLFPTPGFASSKDTAVGAHSFIPG